MKPRLSEPQRLQYLQALGISNYMPRWQLPNAPKPVQNPTAFFDSSPTSSGVYNSSVIKTAQLLDQNAITNSNKNEAATELTEKKQRTTEQQPRPSLTETPISRDQAAAKAAIRPEKAQSAPKAVNPSFTLCFWRISDDLMVVDSRDDQQALPVEKLLLNILAALGLPRQLPKPELVQWPMINAPHQDQGEQAARETLHSFLDAKFVLQPGKYLVLMGDCASEFLLEDDRDYSNKLGQTIKVEEFGLQALVVPSLAEMLLAPGKKAITWQTLKPLQQY